MLCIYLIDRLMHIVHISPKAHRHGDTQMTITRTIADFIRSNPGATLEQILAGLQDAIAGAPAIYAAQHKEDAA